MAPVVLLQKPMKVIQCGQRDSTSMSSMIRKDTTVSIK